MISAAGRYGAACSAKCSISTAPIAKFGATTTLVADPCSTIAAAIRSWSSSVMPGGPTTTWTPFATHHRTLSSTAEGCVKSTATPARASSSAWRSLVMVTPSTCCPAATVLTAATSSRSGSAATAAHTVRPIRPFAPSTPTRTAMGSGLRVEGGHLRLDVRVAPAERVLVERPEHRQRHGLRQHAGGDAVGVLEAHPVDAVEHLVHGEDLPVPGLGPAEAGHAPAGLLEREHHGALHVPLGPFELLALEPVGGDLGGLAPQERERLLGPRGRRPGVHREQPGLRVHLVVGVHRVGEPALLPDLLEQPA